MPEQVPQQLAPKVSGNTLRFSPTNVFPVYATKTIGGSASQPDMQCEYRLRHVLNAIRLVEIPNPYDLNKQRDCAMPAPLNVVTA